MRSVDVGGTRVGGGTPRRDNQKRPWVEDGRLEGSPCRWTEGGRRSGWSRVSGPIMGCGTDEGQDAGI